MGDGIFWGCDSGNPISTAQTGWASLGDYVINGYYPSSSIFFWGRYFYGSGPSFDWHGNAEATALLYAIRKRQGSGHAGWIAPFTFPPQGNLGGSYSLGYSDAGVMLGQLENALSTNANLHEPGSNIICCYLDVEPTTTISSNYWKGWATRINTALYPGGSGTYPFYACAYFDWKIVATCNTLGAFMPQNNLGKPSNPSTTCWNMWTLRPQSTSCSSPGPAWGGFGCGGLVPQFWQYDVTKMCPGPPPVDLDETNPSVVGPFHGGMLDFILICS
jgi:hypothetical protein